MDIGQTHNAPSICFTYDNYDPLLLEAILPHVDFIETTPDSISMIQPDNSVVLHPKILDQLKQVANSKKIVAHGVGMSIGTFEGLSTDYVKLLDELVDNVELYWHSEHLGYTTINGECINVMLPVNRNKENLQLICERIYFLQERYKMPFLIENIAHLLPDYDSQYSDAEFLNEITKQTGCGLILDMYNIYCDAYNYQFNIDAFLKELNLDSVREIHLANGSIYKDRMMDIHSNAVDDAVLQLTRDILPNIKNLEIITFELLPEAVPTMGYQAIQNELIRIKSLLQFSA
jgi:uncharacterized protein